MVEVLTPDGECLDVVSDTTSTGAPVYRDAEGRTYAATACAELLTVKEAAGRARCSIWAVYRAVASGGLECIDLGAVESGGHGHCLRVRAGDVKEWATWSSK